MTEVLEGAWERVQWAYNAALAAEADGRLADAERWLADARSAAEGLRLVRRTFVAVKFNGEDVK